MIANNNLSVLPFYTSIDEQNHRKSYAYGQIYPLLTPVNRILPFQIMRPYSEEDITEISLYTKNGVFVENLLTAMTGNGLHTYIVGDEYEVISYSDIMSMPTHVAAEGQYYLVLRDESNTWYSEIFTVVSDIQNTIKIEWWDEENLFFDAGAIIYKDGDYTFRNRLYLSTELGKPEYKFEEEGETRDGYYFAEKQISEKTFKCVALAPEYLCDVMRLIRLSDYVVVTDKYNRQYDCDTFLITPKWQEQGDLASVEIEFETATVVKKTAKGYIIARRGDFNNDFNNDYNNG